MIIKTSISYSWIRERIGQNVLHFTAATQDVLLVATPEPTSITDAYALIKVLNQRKLIKKFRLIVNRVSPEEALKVTERSQMWPTVFECCY